MVRGQRLPEYLVVFAVVVVLGLVMYGIVGNIPTITDSSERQTSEAYWLTADIGIPEYSLSATTNTLTLTLQNNIEGSVSINSLRVGSDVDNKETTLIPGETIEYKISKNCENLGDEFSYQVDVYYLEMQTNLNRTLIGDRNLVGECVE